MEVLYRFWSNVEKTDGCWLWTGGITSAGYGAFYPWPGSKQVSAHRFCYENEIGPIPVGLELDHLCRVRHCVRPSDLEPVTRQINLLRGDTIVAKQAARIVCSEGHQFDRVYNGKRHCSVCDRRRALSSYYKRKVH